eukprot:CAMPEP_0185581310 /NCGR_PEP_ID=MMETSP0434-20130131/18233_1 /TAXON_ID=626734 ORGANISM="Favella taraikaensis, Strain Fe Narragansett Bay" /NCGR_SAMPLE_ID=MMETSP0434 /ASSEMBLY_ACC=CAM_ASM_000379 /LENGTH=57 /DNA_ID=CAMNT_0028199815 /DNA_START=403 /DNA_END=576 /DNA_ORIENTATION=-
MQSHYNYNISITYKLKASYEDANRAHALVDGNAPAMMRFIQQTVSQPAETTKVILVY